MASRKDVLLEEPFPDLLCGLCQDVLDEPIQIRCPEDHIFCQACINRYTEQHTTCPFCQTAIDKTQFQPSKFVQRQIGRLRSRCLYHSLGCPWQGIFSDDHASQCDYRTVSCPNNGRGCKSTPRIMDLEKHKSECDYELLSCPNAVPDCEPFLRKDLSEHESRCQFYPCAYAAEGCSFVGTLVDVKAHCDRYCGKLHQRLQQLEEECERLKHLLSQHNISYDTDAMQYSPSAEDKEGPTKASNENQMMNLTNTDLLSMFDDSLFSFGLDGNMNGFLGKANYCNDISTNILPISSTIGASTVSNPGTQSSGALPLPKRSSNGKLIRYNKNVRMAHNALRLARQKANLDDLDSADMDAILGDFDWLKPGEMRGRTEGGDTTMNNPTIAPIVSVDSPTSIELANLMSQQTLSSQSSAPSPPPSLPFSNLDDVTKFLAACPNGMDHAMAKTTSSSVGQLAVGGKLTSSPLASPIKEFTPSLARSQTSKQKADNHSNTALLRAKKNTTTKKKDNPGRISQALNTNNSANASTTTTPAATTTPTTTPTTTTSTNRPMFVLASSYLTNYK